MITFKKLRLCLMAIMVTGLVGCAAAGNDSLRLESEASVNQQMIEGVTTKKDVKNLFGSPFSTSYTDDGLEIWKYQLEKTSLDGPSYIPFVALFAGSSSGVKKELTILFNLDDKVKKFNMSESNIKVRTGMFNQ